MEEGHIVPDRTLTLEVRKEADRPQDGVGTYTKEL
jgi:hypothetical protein